MVKKGNVAEGEITGESDKIGVSVSGTKISTEKQNGLI